MSINTFATVSRNNVTQLTNQPVQIDEVSETMAGYYDNAHPYDVFKAIIRYTTFAFHRQDLITDTVNIDPVTNTHTLYRVVGQPRPYPDGHVEMIVNRFAGSQS